MTRQIRLSILQAPKSMTRGDCSPGRDRRMAGEEMCPRVLCRYHLLGDIARRSKTHEGEAVEAMRGWIEGDWEGCCALDHADLLEEQGRSMPDPYHAAMLGVTVKRLTQIAAEAGYGLRQHPEVKKMFPERFALEPEPKKEQGLKTRRRRPKPGQLGLF